MPSNILLLRAQSSEEGDKYESTFDPENFTVACVPVLETVFINVEELRNILTLDPLETRYSGVIITSARACEAWKACVESLEEASPERGNDGWRRIPFYVVGKATESSLKQIRAAFPSSPYISDDIRGASSGTSAELGRFIISDLPERPSKLLYLTGDKNRDIMPNLLKEAGIDLVPLQVYATHGSSRFPNDLEDAISTMPKGRNYWIVFFAPSAAEFTVRHIERHFTLRRLNDTTCNSSGLVQVAAIGPTTANFLSEKLGLRVDAVAAKPTPSDLASAIALATEKTQTVA